MAASASASASVDGVSKSVSVATVNATKSDSDVGGKPQAARDAVAKQSMSAGGNVPEH